MLRLVCLFLCISPVLLWSQNDPVAEAIKANVVAIKTQFPSGGKELGFGFVVGERNNMLYLVTAGHVIQEDGAEPGKENANSILVRFCGDDHEYAARFLHASNRPFDVGLLEVDKPSGYVWKADCLGARPAQGQSVGYIGHRNTCYVPTATVRGTVNQLSLDRIYVDINGIGRGTSGAPLIAADGIVGMIVTAESGRAEALTLERLRDEVTQREEYPWRFGLRRGEPLSPDIITYNMVKIEGGSYEMGCKPERDGNCQSNETPIHLVNVSSFYLGKYEVTYQEFKAFAEESRYLTVAEQKGYSYVWNGTEWEQKQGINWRHNTKGELRGATESKHPVIYVTQRDATAYCAWLSTKTGKSYRLPTEAEWEYAARSGAKQEQLTYAGSNDLGAVGWYRENADGNAHPVGQKANNGLGLCDMSGNVKEWCSDWYDDYYYQSSPEYNPKGPATGTSAVLRGGSWFDNNYACRAAIRFYIAYPDEGYSVIGFRIARNR